MRRKQVFFIILLLILAFSMSFAKGETHEQDISLLQMVHTGPNLLITMDYDISAAPGRGDTESLVMLILLALPEGGFLPAVGTLLFIRTSSGNRLLYWMLNDPFLSAELWQQGIEEIHFQVDYKEISILFIESPDMENPNVEIISFIKLLDIGNLTTTVTDFQPILERFRADYEFMAEAVSTEVITTTTIDISEGTETSDIPSTTTPGVAGEPGFLISLCLGLLVLIGFKRRNRD
ncbi:MAG: hypothetical protein ACW98I_20100 [Candidatus Hodarchaeales archaeon]|jgi:hypothetical protein